MTSGAVRLISGAVPFVAAALRSTDRPFGVNLFAPAITPIEPDDFRRYAQALQPTADRYQLDPSTVALREDDAGWQHKIDLLLADPVPAVSVTFGVPPQDDVRALRRAGSLVLITVTTLQEARSAAAAGADALVVQGSTAGGHSGTHDPTAAAEPVDVVNLTRRVVEATGLPVVAAGGVDGAGVLRRPPAGGRRCGRSRDAPATHRRERSLIDSP